MNTHLRFRHFLLAGFLCASLLSSGCSLFDSEDAQVQFTVLERGNVTANMLKLTVSDGGRRIWQVEGDDFKPIAPGASQRGTRVYRTSKSGRLRLSFILSSDGALVSSGVVELDLRSDWIWDVSFIVGTNIMIPVESCFGCYGSQTFALAPGFGEGDSDSLHVIWGGNSIKHPVIY